MSDLETVLKEKETQINFLKETMEQNEQVIFKVIITDPINAIILNNESYLPKVCTFIHINRDAGPFSLPS